MSKKPPRGTTPEKPADSQPRGQPRQHAQPGLPGPPAPPPAVAFETPAFDRRLMERQLTALRRAFEEHEFATEEEANAFLDQVNASGGLPPAEPRTPLEEAQEIIYQALETTGEQRARLAHKALEVSPDCADAYVLLAEATTNPRRAGRLYEEGVRAGERALGEAFFEQFGQGTRGEGEPGFWNLVETRPYMRARLGLAEVLWHVGKHAEAIDHAKELLRLNPNDNQGIRYLLATWLLVEGDLDALERLLAQYPDDWSANWAYSRVLYTLRRVGPGRQADQALKHALEVNPHVPLYLLGVKPPPTKMPEYYGMGDENEAIAYLMQGVDAWTATPEAVDWLAGALMRLVPIGKPTSRKPTSRKPPRRPKRK